MRLLVHPEWLAGASRRDVAGHELGGYPEADPAASAAWYQHRLAGLGLIEVRGATLPEEIALKHGAQVSTVAGTTPQSGHVICGQCGLKQAVVKSCAEAGHIGPTMPYALQCHCPQCAAEGYTYGGRFFKEVDASDVRRLVGAETEWEREKNAELSPYWPRTAIAFSHMTHQRNPLPDHGYTHWWKMFNPRQLLVHSRLLRAIESAAETWPLDLCEQVLGAFQQYLRMMNMFSFWHQTYDKLAPFMSNANYNPRSRVVETNMFGKLGYGRWLSCEKTVLDSLSWCREPWELAVPGETATTKSVKVAPGDAVTSGHGLLCGNSTSLASVPDGSVDAVITDPPFGDNLYYADCSDFFYVWLRIPLKRWYAGLPEHEYFVPERTPHSVEAIDNPAEHPDDREAYERERFITSRVLCAVCGLTGDDGLEEGDENPLYRPIPSSDFYCQTLTACWAEAHRVLKPGGLLAFTFHHSEDEPWLDVLESLFNAGFILVATYPIRSDESKGEGGQFGSKKIEYDIIHVCRKRLDSPTAVSYARMRRWVKQESAQLKLMLEHTHGEELPESDLRVILRGKALEFYSRHYGEVRTGEGEILTVRDALIGINQLLDDLISEGTGGIRAPEEAEPTSRLFLSIFAGRDSVPRDELHKILRGTGVSQSNFEARRWIKADRTTIHVAPIAERFVYFTTRGRTRKILKADLDQAHFLIGSALPGSNMNIERELDKGSFKVKASVGPILSWLAETAADTTTRNASRIAAQLLEHWRTKISKLSEDRQMNFLDELGVRDER